MGFGRVLRTGLSSLRDRAASRLAALRFNPSRGDIRAVYRDTLKRYPKTMKLLSHDEGDV